MKKEILVLKGGDSSEHGISLKSADYLESQIDQNLFNINSFEITQHNIDQLKNLLLNKEWHGIIPVIHGYPGETGTIQGLFESLQLPYIGCDSKSSHNCFNKAVTKFLLEQSGIKTTPFIVLTDESERSQQNLKRFFQKHGEVFIKASTQGSSIGCYPVSHVNELTTTLHQAFQYSDEVVMEKKIEGRELEVAACEYKGEIFTTAPGEILCDTRFYSYEKKYEDQTTQTVAKAESLTSQQIKSFQKIAKDAFFSMKLRHLSRVDFFLTNEGEILLNEINTFPGMTEISLFPKMLEANGLTFSNFINSLLSEL